MLILSHTDAQRGGLRHNCWGAGRNAAFLGFSWRSRGQQSEVLMLAGPPRCPQAACPPPGPRSTGRPAPWETRPVPGEAGDRAAEPEPRGPQRWCHPPAQDPGGAGSHSCADTAPRREPGLRDVSRGCVRGEPGLRDVSWACVT